MRNKFWRSLFTGFLALILSFAIHFSLSCQISGSASDLIQKNQEYDELGQSTIFRILGEF